MIRDTILVVDEDAVTYQLLQNCFAYENDIQIHWVCFARDAFGLQLPVRVVLIAVYDDEDYENIADLKRFFPDAVFFVLCQSMVYDAFLARNVGAIGAFMRPLSAAAIQSRLEEFLFEHPKPLLEQIFVPTRNEQGAKLISFSPNVDHDVEQMVREAVPVVVEQILRLELTHPTTLRNNLLLEIRKMIQEELHKI